MERTAGQADAVLDADKGFLAALPGLIRDSRRPLVLCCNSPKLPAGLSGVGVQEVVMLKPKAPELLRLLVLVLAAEGRAGVNLQDVIDVIRQQAPAPARSALQLAAAADWRLQQQRSELASAAVQVDSCCHVSWHSRHVGAGVLGSTMGTTGLSELSQWAGAVAVRGGDDDGSSSLAAVLAQVDEQLSEGLFGGPLVVGITLSAIAVGAAFSAGALAFSTLLLPLILLTGFGGLLSFGLMATVGAAFVIPKMIFSMLSLAVVGGGLLLGWGGVSWLLSQQSSATSNQGSSGFQNSSRQSAASRSSSPDVEVKVEDDKSKEDVKRMASELREFDELLARKEEQRRIKQWERDSR
eukprot:gene13566-13692_t